jgi:hypothetical protein
MMRVPDLSSRVYGLGEEWLQARAFEPEEEEEEEVDPSELPESALERLLPRERPELISVFGRTAAFRGSSTSSGRRCSSAGSSSRCD